MKLTTWLIMSFIEVLVILSLSGVCAAEDFTLSDDVLMTMLDRINYHVWAKSSIVDRRDRPGPGVEFDIYFPGTRTPENHLDCVSVAKDPNSLLFATGLRSFDAFTLKFTLLAVNGDPEAIHTGRLVVGACINGSYRPECVTLDKQTPVIDRNNKRVADPNTAISRTTFKSSEIHSAGFTMHQLTSEGWDPNGTTITFLIEPAPGAVVIPEIAAENPPELTGKVIYVDAAAAGIQNGSDWANAFKTLYEAMAAASTGNQIWVAQGIYRPCSSPDRTATFTLRSGLAIYGGFPAGGGRLEDVNPAVNKTILSGDLKGNDAVTETSKLLLTDPTRTDNAVHVVTAGGTDLTALLHGFIITGGNASEFNDQGGGLYCKVGSPTISNCIFTRNSAESGGAVYTWKGNCWFINCRFADNYASDSGAAIYNFDSSSLFVNCILTGNRAAEKGGGMYNDLGRVQIINCSVLNNYAYAGGGVYNHKSVPLLTNCILWGNTSRYGADEPAQLYGVKVEAGHCCIQGLTPELGGRNCLVKDPQITDIAGGGYRIAPGSPCINAGDNKAIPNIVNTDIDGNPRLSGAAIDIGACEIQ